MKKVKETKVFQNLSYLGENAAIRFVCRLVGKKYESRESIESWMNTYDASELDALVASGQFDNAIICAASEYVNRTQAARRHSIVCDAIGFRFPLHELVADEKRALVGARVARKENEEKRARYTANVGIFDTLMTKRVAQDETLAQCKEAINSLDAAKVAKNNPARTFLENQISACESEIIALTKEMYKAYNEYYELSLIDIIPPAIVDEFADRETTDN